MHISFRRLLGLGLFGVMLATAVPAFASPQAKKGAKKGGKKSGNKKSQKKGGRGGK